ncbi:MAG: hypothetical protein D6748_15445 [Calditrichaeota bacterium]|nr:MAG: hypothetical protein D6748_15445 [Calditrichota bacterium]
MKLIDTLLITPTKEILEEITSNMPLEEVEVNGVKGYRLEISEDLVFLFYPMGLGDNPDETPLKDIKEYFRGVLLVLHEKYLLDDALMETEMEQFLLDLGSRPVVLAVRMEMKNLNYLNEILQESGMHLAKKGKLLFWHPLMKSSQKKVWDIFFKQIMKN